MHDVGAGAEALTETAGLLGAAMDHAGRLAGYLVMGPNALRLAEGGVIIGEHLERQLLLPTMLLQVSEVLKLSLPGLSPPTEDTLVAAAVLNPSALELEAWLGRSATTPACAHCGTTAAAVGVGLTSLLFWTDRGAGRQTLSSAGYAASKAEGVLGEPLLTLSPLPLPPQLGLLLLQGLKSRLGSCVREVRSIKAAWALKSVGVNSSLQRCLHGKWVLLLGVDPTFSELVKLQRMAGEKLKFPLGLC